MFDTCDAQLVILAVGPPLNAMNVSIRTGEVSATDVHVYYV